MSAARLSTSPPGSTPSQRFRPEQRLRRQGDFRRVRAQGRRVDAGAFTLWWQRRDSSAPSPSSPVRVGVVASIAAVGSAVQRNAAKRRLRELFRRHQGLFPAGTDLLLVARSPLNRMEFREAETRFLDACRRLPDVKHE